MFFVAGRIQKDFYSVDRVEQFQLKSTTRKMCPLLLPLVTGTACNMVMIKGAAIINMHLEIKAECSGKQTSKTGSKHCHKCPLYHQCPIKSWLPTQNCTKSIYYLRILYRNITYIDKIQHPIPSNQTCSISLSLPLPTSCTLFLKPREVNTFDSTRECYVHSG